MNTTQTISTNSSKRRIRPSVYSTIAGWLLPGLRPRTLLRRRLEHATRGGFVLAGPFTAMRYVGQAVGSMWWPKILGTYELELEDIFLDLCRQRPARVVDIGAAEGYYAVGMAWRCPETRVVAFEAELAGRELLARLASLNGVAGRVQIEGYCDHAALIRALGSAHGGLIICDIEGGERDLLDPALVPALVEQRWTLLVEIHDHVDPRIGQILANRFKSTHTIEEFASRPRKATDLPPSVGIAWLGRWIPAFLDERRPGQMRWLLLRPSM